MVTGSTVATEVVGGLKVPFDIDTGGLVDGSEVRGRKQGQTMFRLKQLAA